MLRHTIKLTVQDFSYLDIRTHLWSTAKAFWRFSTFYGDYCSRPVSDRRKFIQPKK
jgi:hypothetical protein